MAGLPDPGSDVPGPFDLSGTRVGQWELARLKAVSGNALVLTKPLVHDFDAGSTQVISVPEHTSVSIVAGAAPRSTGPARVGAEDGC